MNNLELRPCLNCGLKIKETFYFHDKKGSEHYWFDVFCENCMFGWTSFLWKEEVENEEEAKKELYGEWNKMCDRRHRRHNG